MENNPTGKTYDGALKLHSALLTNWGKRNNKVHLMQKHFWAHYSMACTYKYWKITLSKNVFIMFNNYSL